MPVSLHDSPYRTEARNLQELCGVLEEAMKSAEESRFLPLMLPPNGEAASHDELMEYRRQIRDRLIKLFLAGLSEVAECDADYLEAAGDEAQKLFDLDDEYFNSAITDIQCGVIQLLIGVIDYIKNTQNPEEGFMSLCSITADVGSNKITDLYWDVESEDPTPTGFLRKEVLLERLRAMQTEGLQISNERIVNDLLARFPKDHEIFLSLAAIYEEATLELDVSDYRSAEWLHLLVIALSQIKKITPPLVGALESLKREIGIVIQGSGYDPVLLAKAVHDFAEKTFPRLVREDASIAA